MDFFASDILLRELGTVKLILEKLNRFQSSDQCSLSHFPKSSQGCSNMGHCAPKISTSLKDNASAYPSFAHKKRSYLELASSTVKTTVEMDNIAKSMRERGSKATLKLLLCSENLLNLIVTLRSR